MVPPEAVAVVRPVALPRSLKHLASPEGLKLVQLVASQPSKTLSALEPGT